MWRQRLTAFYRNYKKVILLGAGLVFVALFSWTLVKLVRQLKEPVIPVIRAVPAQTAWYIEFRDAKAVWEKLKSGNEVVDELRNFPFFGELYHEISRIDSSCSSDEQIRDLMKGMPLLVACSYTKSGKAEYLYLINLPDAHQEETIFGYLKDRWTPTMSITETEVNGVAVAHAVTPSGSRWNYSVHKGIFMISASPELVAASLEALRNETSIVQAPGYAEISGTMGTKVDANFCINLKKAAECMGGLVNKEQEAFFDFLDKLGDWGGMDLIIRKDELLMSGYLSASANQYLSVFKDEKPQKLRLNKSIPYNTAVMLYFGSEKMRQLNEKQRSLRNTEPPSRTKGYAELEKKCGCSIEDAFYAGIGNEMALVITESPSASFKANTYAVFSVNAFIAEKELKKISVAVEDLDKSAALDTGLKIRQIPLTGLFPDLFGESFSFLTDNYYLIYDNLLIFGNSPLALKNYIASINSGKTLVNNENYKAFSDNVSENASFCLFVNIRKASELLMLYINPELRQDLGALSVRLRNFQAFAVQLEPEKNLYYVNVFLKYNPSYKEENPSVWETRTDSVLIYPPQIVKRGPDKSPVVIAADASDKIYLIDAIGRIVWTYQCPSPLAGPVQIADADPKSEARLVLATKKHLIVLDMSGKPLPGFPLKLKTSVTSAPLLADYSGKGDYRIFFVCEDHKLYNYGLSGKVTAGWTPPVAAAAVQSKPEYLRFMKKDLIIITDVQGHCSFYDRRGKQAFPKTASAFVRSHDAPFALFEDGKNSRIITTDINGRIIRITPDGKLESINLGRFPENHHFRYLDFDGNEIKDYLFNDSTTLTVFDVNKKIIFELEFPLRSGTAVVSATPVSNAPFFGVVGTSSSQLFLFNKNGCSPMNKYLTGKLPFCIGKLDDSGYYSLVTGGGNIIYNYYLNDFSTLPF